MVIKSGQVTLSGTAQQLTASDMSPAVFQWRARVGNVNRAYWGDKSVTTTTGYDLEAGEEETFERRTQVGAGSYDVKPSDIYVVGTNGDVVSWVAFL